MPRVQPGPRSCCERIRDRSRDVPEGLLPGFGFDRRPMASPPSRSFAEDRGSTGSDRSSVGRRLHEALRRRVEQQTLRKPGEQLLLGGGGLGSRVMPVEPAMPVTVDAQVPASPRLAFLIPSKELSNHAATGVSEELAVGSNLVRPEPGTLWSGGRRCPRRANSENDRGLNGAVGFDTGDVRVPGALGTLRVYDNPGPIEALGLWGNGVSRNTWWASDIFAAGALVAAGLALYQEFSFPRPLPSRAS